MKKTIKTMIAVVALSGTVAANVQAEEMIINKGDTLWGIAQANQISVGDLKEWNQLSTDLIFPGDSIEISPKKLYPVQSGESLWSIARKHNVTVDELIQWNELKTDLIQPDQKLVIYENINEESIAKMQNTTKTAINEKPETIPADQSVKTETKQTNTTKTENVEPNAAPVNNEIVPKEITVTATAYTASCEGCSGITKIGVNLKENPEAKVIAVDPTIIPLGSKVFVEGYGNAIAADVGGSIKGNKIDIFIASEEDAIQWGSKTVKVKILE